MSGNSLQAVLNHAKAKNEKPESEKPSPKRATPSKKGSTTSAKVEPAPRITQPGRTGTKLIGGHFPPDVSTQLRIIAAEEDTTIQALLAEALDDLFVKKGKKRIVR